MLTLGTSVALISYEDLSVVKTVTCHGVTDVAEDEIRPSERTACTGSVARVVLWLCLSMCRPDQIMQDKAGQYARKGIAKGRSIVAVRVCVDGLLLMAENPSVPL